MRELRAVREGALFAYNRLASEAERLKEPRFPWKPKHRIWDHGFRTAIFTSISPCCHWTYSDETWAGHMAAILMRAHAATRRTVCLERWIMVVFSEYGFLL